MKSLEKSYKSRERETEKDKENLKSKEEIVKVIDKEEKILRKMKSSNT